MSNQQFSRVIAENREIPAFAGMTIISLISTRRKQDSSFFDSLEGGDLARTEATITSAEKLLEFARSPPARG
jgi:hypothetical protein